VVFLYGAEWPGNHADPYPLLAQAFERFNNGSGHEDPSYFARRLDVVLAVIIGCGGSEDEARRWATAWLQLRSGGFQDAPGPVGAQYLAPRPADRPGRADPGGPPAQSRKRSMS
jgi:hypothetical protein